MFKEFTRLKTISGLAFLANLISLIIWWETSEKVANAEEALTGLALISIDSWTLTQLIFFENAMYGLLLIYFASYALIFFGIGIGRWAFLLSYVIAVPASLVLDGLVFTIPEGHLDTMVSMLDGCLIYLLFFCKNVTDR